MRFRHSVTHDGHIEVESRKQLQGAMYGRENPVVAIAERAATEQRQKTPVVSGVGKVQDAGAYGCLIRSLKY
jgi:hypothetical protein